MRISLVVLALLVACSTCHGKEQRWSSFAEDNDLSYYLDRQSLVSLPDNVYIFWLKSVAKDKEYFPREYNLSDLSYILTNYELDCAAASYRIRGTILFDKQHKELNKVIAASSTAFEPVPPESLLELAQAEICVKQESAADAAAPEDEVAAPVLPEAPAVTVPPPSIM